MQIKLVMLSNILFSCLSRHLGHRQFFMHGARFGIGLGLLIFTDQLYIVTLISCYPNEEDNR